MDKFVSIYDQFKNAEGLDEKASAGLAGMTSILNGWANILGKARDLSTVKDTTQYDIPLYQMQNAGMQNHYTTDSLMQDSLSRPMGFGVERNSLGQSDRDIASGMVGSTLQGAATGFELGGLWGGIAGAVAGLGASGLAAFSGRRKAHREEDELRWREKQEEKMMNERYAYQADNVNNYMMNQAFAHRAAEGGKIQTTISMNDFAKKVLAKRPYAEGGQMMSSMERFNTHGGFFSDGLIRIDAGGTHEENPYGGVKYGTDPQGVDNLVEQNERIWKDYVFSDRLKPSRKMLKEFNLPEKYAGMTFASISDKLSEESESRPNDAVSKSGLNAMMGRLEACQEQLKIEKAEKEQAAMAMQEAPLPEDMMIAQQPMVPQQIPQDAMMQQEMPMIEQGAPMMAAYGGHVNTFGPGGWLNSLLSRYRENHVPQNFQAYENDPYMYGEIDPSVVIADKNIGEPVGLEMPWYTPGGAVGKIRSAANTVKAAKAAKGSKVARSAQRAFSEFDDMIAAAEKGSEAKKAKAAAKAAEKAAKEAAEKEANRIAGINKEVADRLASEFETARTKADVARGEYDAANLKMKELAKKASKSMNEDDIAAAKEARTVLGSKYDALQEAMKAQELASLNNSEKAVARAQKEAVRNANKEMKAAERSTSRPTTEQASPSGQQAAEPTHSTPSDDRSLVRRIWSGDRGKGWYDPRRWGLWKPGLVGFGMRIGAYPAIQAIKEEINAKGKREDAPVNPLPSVNSHAYGGNLFFDGGESYNPYGDLWYGHYADPIGAAIAMSGNSSAVNTGFGNVSGSGSGSRKRIPIPVAPVLTDEQIQDMLLSRNRIASVMDGNIPRVDTKFLEGAPTFASLAEGYEDKRNKNFGDMVRKEAAALGKSSSPNDDDVNALPTWMRYAGAIGNGLAYLDSALREPDYSLADSYKSMMRSALHRQVSYRPQFVAPRYNPVDVNMMDNQTRAMSTAGMRQMANSGMGPSMMAVAPMMGYNAAQAVGSAMAQGRLGNYQEYLNHINALNQINGQVAAGNMQAQAQNANLQEYANQFNAGMLDRYNQFRDAEDTAKAQAITAGMNGTGLALSNIGRENFSMNQINSNPYFMGYGVGVNGIQGYSKPAACGGKRNTKKK